MSLVSDIILAGVDASKPTLTTYHAGYLYFATDTVKLYRWSGSAWVQVAAAGGVTQYTDEMAQDAIGAMIADTDTIDLTYTDATPELKADAKKQMSITADASGLKLSGDVASPGNNKVYGTDGSGVKGWKADPAGGGGGGLAIGESVYLNALTRPVDTTIQGTWSITNPTDMPYRYFLTNSTNANGDGIGFNVYLYAGTYKVNWNAVKNTDRPKVDVKIDTTLISNVDLYAGSLNVTNIQTVTGIVIASDGLYSLRFVANTKNASSSGYTHSYSGIELIRTA